MQPGQRLLVIVPLDDIWITANFKEMQLKRMKPGQPVTVRVDTFDRDYKGKLRSPPTSQVCTLISRRSNRAIVGIGVILTRAP